MADGLREIIDQARRDMPDVPDEMWKRLEASIRANFGTQRPYIASHRKSRLLAEIEAAEDRDANKLGNALGLTPRRIRQLKSLL